MATHLGDLLQRLSPPEAGRALAHAERRTLARLAEVLLQGSPVAIAPEVVADNVDRFLLAGRSQRTWRCRALLRLVEWLPVVAVGRPLSALDLAERRRLVERHLVGARGLWWLCAKAR